MDTAVFNVGGPCLLLVVAPIIQAVICYYAVRALEAVPPESRLREPKHVWLLMVPIFNIVWNFFVFPRISESFQHYFYSRGVAKVGDCGEKLAWWYCGLCVAFVAPCINLAAMIAAAVVIILYLQRVDELRLRILRADPGAR